jgi:hypothetical protein
MSSGFNFGMTMRIVRDTATALGRSQDAVVYAASYAKIQRLFHETYWNPTIGTYGNGQQAALIYALYLGAVPPANVPRIFAQLLALIEMTPPPPPPNEQQDATRKDAAATPPPFASPPQKCKSPPCIGKHAQPNVLHHLNWFYCVYCM